MESIRPALPPCHASSAVRRMPVASSRMTGCKDESSQSTCRSGPETLARLSTTCPYHVKSYGGMRLACDEPKLSTCGQDSKRGSGSSRSCWLEAGESPSCKHLPYSCNARSHLQRESAMACRALARLCLRPTRVRKQAARRHSRSSLSSTVRGERHSRQRLLALSRAERTLRSVGGNLVRLNPNRMHTCDQQIPRHPDLALGR